MKLNTILGHFFVQNEGKNMPENLPHTNVIQLVAIF